MPRLTVILDSISREREAFELTAGALLCAELQRLFPDGLGEMGPRWNLYAGEITPRMELTHAEIVDWELRELDAFILVRRPGTGYEVLIQNLVVSLFLSQVAKLLSRPSARRRSLTLGEQVDTGTNQLAAQQNMLRPGARVPEILGRMRVYPDLLSMPAEQWAKRRQTIRQLFVVGMGSYLVDEVRLGETLGAGVSGLSWVVYRPGELVPQFPAVRRAADVSGISLMTEDEADLPATAATFNAAAKTMTLATLLPIPNNYPVQISGTLFNDGLRWVVGVPAPGSAAPFVYTLEGPVADESGANALIAVAESRPTLTRYVNYGSFSGDIINPPSGFQATATQGIADIAIGDVIEVTQGATTYRGTLNFVMNAPDIANPWINTHIGIDDLDGNPITFPNLYQQVSSITVFDEGEASSGGGGPPPLNAAAWTDWHTAPGDDPEEIWLDFGFPLGLAHYVSSVRNSLTIGIQVEFRRVGTTSAATRFYGYSEATNGALQWTERVLVSTLGLTGTAAIEVRVRRATVLYVDDANNQYVQDTRWQALSSMRTMAARTYPDVTTVLMTLANSRSAVNMGEVAFNAVVTRELPTWTGSSWSAAAPTQKWADNFVARCKAIDGGNLPDALIDVAGIYALQASLDGLDAGAQGVISLAIDQEQDLDAELAQIADVIRAQVYRVGRKIFVVRDQDTPGAIALFNGRAKSAEAETVSVRLKSADDYDAVTITWIDVPNGWKQREYVYPEPPFIPANSLRVGVLCANWAQAYRRARFEWARLKFRREQISVPVTEDGRICRPGDVVNITDDLAHLAIAAGEVLLIEANVLTLDKQVTFGAGAHTLLVRDIAGQLVDAIPVTAVAGSPNKVQLSRASSVTIKGRDEALGTLYAFYNDASANVRPWLLTAVEIAGPYVQLSGVNYTARVYEGDGVSLPPAPAIPLGLSPRVEVVA